MELHDQIRIARERLGLDQAALAYKMGISKTDVANWEKGAVPHKTRLMELQQLLGVTLYVTGTPGQTGKGEYDFLADDISFLLAVQQLPKEQRAAMERIVSAMVAAVKPAKSGRGFHVRTSSPTTKESGRVVAKKGVTHGSSTSVTASKSGAGKSSSPATNQRRSTK